MGQGYEFKCKCGYSFAPYLGVGFLFPSLYQELIDSAREGELGAELQTFLTEHPDGAIDAETVALRCKNCGEYWSAPNLSMYCPKDSETGNNATAAGAMRLYEKKYVDPADLQEEYRLYAKYPHKCIACDGDMEIVSEEELDKNGIVCPRCGSRIREYTGIMWD